MMSDEFEELKTLHGSGLSFEEAYDEVFGDDTGALVEAFEYWSEWEAGEP